jgi:Uncharacterized conserved protein (COG2071)
MLVIPDRIANESSARLVAPAVAAARGDVRVQAEWRHVSHIVYSVPRERVGRLLPAGFEAEDSTAGGRGQTRISVTSFLDLGNGRDVFEQTDYRLHAVRAGTPVCWLLGSSIGSLGGVAMRRMWQSPWHLAAMEFEVWRDAVAGRYRAYRLCVQSEWANAAWTLSDTGRLLADEPEESADYFLRRDGSIGLRRVRLPRSFATQARVTEARCDLLERLGLLTSEELGRPLQASLQSATIGSIDAPRPEAGRLFASGSSAGH